MRKPLKNEKKRCFLKKKQAKELKTESSRFLQKKESGAKKTIFSAWARSPYMALQKRENKGGQKYLPPADRS